MRGTRLVLQATAALGAAGAGVALTAAPAVAIGGGPVVVTPHTGLSNNEVVSVSWDTGEAWLGSVHSAVALECEGAIPRGMLDGICFFSTPLQAVPLGNKDLGFEGSITVQRNPTPLVNCTTQCSIDVLQGGDFSSGSVPITFK